MIADHWEFVIAAYALAAIVLGGYWRRLRRQERELTVVRARSRAGRVAA